MTDMERTVETENTAEEKIVTIPEPQPEQQIVPVAQNVEVVQTTGTAEKKKGLLQKPVALIAAAVAVVAIVLFVIFGVPAIRYASGVSAFEKGNYAKAVEQLESFDKAYKESDTYLAQAKLGVHYANAGLKVEAGEYAEAIKEYRSAGNFLDARDLLRNTYILYGDSLVEQAKYDEAVEAYSGAAATEKIVAAYNLKGDALFGSKQYTEAADAYKAAQNSERQTECGVMLVEEKKDYAAAFAVLENLESTRAVSYRNYANGMVSLAAKDYQTALDSFSACTGLLDADKQNKNAAFLLAEKCLHEGYLNKAKRLYNSLPGNYSQNGIAVADRLALLNKNQKFLDLVGVWSATDTYFRVQADSTTSSYYYYWYYEDLNTGSVTVTCPYNDNGTFTIQGTATYPSYQNFSSNASDLKIDMETFTFSSDPVTRVPRQIDTSSTTKLVFTGSRFELQYKYVNTYANVYWHYTFTSNVKYANHYSLGADR